jgi:putative transposase
MGHTYTNILLHIVFSTKDREPLIPPGRARSLHRYLASVCTALGCPSQCIGGTENHVHICCKLARTQTCAELIEELKSGSSRWMKVDPPSVTGFAWQSGYGAFSIDEGRVDALRAYIDGQSGHHARISFEDEYRDLLRQHGVVFDERYVWG